MGGYVGKILVLFFSFFIGNRGRTEASSREPGAMVPRDLGWQPPLKASPLALKAETTQDPRQEVNFPTLVTTQTTNRRPTRCSFTFFFFFLNKKEWGFPGGAVVENLPANAGDTGSSPGLGRSHMPRSNGAREPQLLSLRLWSLCSATREARQ